MTYFIFYKTFNGRFWSFYGAFIPVYMPGAGRKFIRVKKKDICFLSNFRLTVSFTLMYFLPAPGKQAEVQMHHYGWVRKLLL